MFKLGETEIKSPSGFNLERYTITKAARVASGDMVMEFVANKRKFVFKYDAITATDLNTIIYALWTSVATSKKCFLELTYVENGATKTATVYAGGIPAELHSAKTTEWVWKNVTFSLIEK